MRLGIVGYGNLGCACERVALDSGFFDDICIYSRRPDVKSPYKTKVCCQSEALDSGCDVLVLCVGSKSDMPQLGLSLAEHFNTVDSFDTHAKIPEYLEKLQRINLEHKTLSFVGIGWDPGLFSLIRGLFCGILPDSKPQTFWGKGVSQGHSEAIRGIDGVLNAKQFTIPKEAALKSVREGRGNKLSERDKHLRECYVVPKQGANLAEIEEKIKTMPDYFAQYDTIVHFVDEKWFLQHCSGMEHGGFVVDSDINCGYRNNMEFSLSLESNPYFTASVLIAYAKANCIMAARGEIGTKTILDIPISQILPGDWIDKARAFI